MSNALLLPYVGKIVHYVSPQISRKFEHLPVVIMEVCGNNGHCKLAEIGRPSGIDAREIHHYSDIEKAPGTWHFIEEESAAAIPGSDQHTVEEQRYALDFKAIFGRRPSIGSPPPPPINQRVEMHALIALQLFAAQFPEMSAAGAVEQADVLMEELAKPKKKSSIAALKTEHKPDCALRSCLDPEPSKCDCGANLEPYKVGDFVRVSHEDPERKFRISPWHSNGINGSYRLENVSSGEFVVLDECYFEPWPTQQPETNEPAHLFFKPYDVVMMKQNPMGQEPTKFAIHENQLGLTPSKVRIQDVGFFDRPFIVSVADIRHVNPRRRLYPENLELIKPMSPTMATDKCVPPFPVNAESREIKPIFSTRGADQTVPPCPVNDTRFLNKANVAEVFQKIGATPLMEHMTVPVVTPLPVPPNFPAKPPDPKEALQAKMEIILRGPSGCGKTFWAQRLAAMLHKDGLAVQIFDEKTWQHYRSDKNVDNPIVIQTELQFFSKMPFARQIDDPADPVCSTEEDHSYSDGKCTVCGKKCECSEHMEDNGPGSNRCKQCGLTYP